MDTIKYFVVVEFFVTCEVATIHKSWIRWSEGKVSCYWPDRDQLKLAAKFSAKQDNGSEVKNLTKLEIRIISSSGRPMGYYQLVKSA